MDCQQDNQGIRKYNRRCKEYNEPSVEYSGTAIVEQQIKKIAGASMRLVGRSGLHPWFTRSPFSGEIEAGEKSFSCSAGACFQVYLSSACREREGKGREERPGSSGP